MSSSNRQLAAIMFTDVVGYTALMGSDEDKALSILNTNREIHKKVIKKHGGKWLKEMGDGTLASFPTILDSVYCAGEILQLLEQKGIELRIGIHFGDVVFQNKDIFGDGVNVASRLEPLAEPGEILISQAIHRNIKNKAGISSTFKEAKALKNVDEPIRIYSVSINPDSKPNPPQSRSNSRKFRPVVFISTAAVVLLLIYSLSSYLKSEDQFSPESVKSIIVLPFANISPDPNNEYLCIGIMASIHNKLSKISGFEKVIDRRSAMQYKESTKSMEQIAKEQNVNYILDATVRTINNTVSLLIQLYNVSKGKQVWSNQYQVPLNEIQELEEEAAQALSNFFDLELTTVEQELISADHINASAYDFYLQASKLSDEYLEDHDSLKFLNAVNLYATALEIDSMLADAYADVAYLMTERLLNSHKAAAEEAVTDTILMLANKSLRINPRSEKGLLARGQYYRSIKVDIPKAKVDFQKILRLNPNSVVAYAKLAGISSQYDDDYLTAIQYHFKIRTLSSIDNENELASLGINFAWMGFNNAGSHFFHEAFLLNRDSVKYLSRLAWNAIRFEKFTDGLKLNDEVGKIDSNYINYLGTLLQIHLFRRQHEKAYRIIKENPDLIQKNDQFLKTRHRIGYIYLMNGEEEKANYYLDKQIEFCLQEIKANSGFIYGNEFTYYDLACAYSTKGEIEKAITAILHLENKQMIPHWQLFYMKNDPLLDNIREDQRFKDLLTSSERKFQKEYNRIKKWMEEQGNLQFDNSNIYPFNQGLGLSIMEDPPV